jgi:hypothetical protein
VFAERFGFEKHPSRRISGEYVEGSGEALLEKNFPEKKKPAAKGDALTASFSSSDYLQSRSSSPLTLRLIGGTLC